MADQQQSASLTGVATSATIVLAGIVFGVLLWLANTAGLLGIWLMVAVVPGFFAYLHIVAMATAAGNREPPPAAISQFNAVNVGAQVLHGGLFMLVLVWLANAGWPLQAVIPGVLAILPASFLLLATTRSLLAAFAPAQIVRLVRGLGMDYLVLLAAGLAAVVSISLLERSLPSLLTHVVASYLVFALAAAGGHMLYRRRESLDLPVTTIDEKRERDDRLDENHKWQSVMDEAYLLLRNGETERGYKLLRGQIERDGDRVESYEAVYTRMLEWGMEHHTSQVAGRLVERLIAGGQLQRALEVAEQRLRHDEGFRPSAPSCIRLAAFARSVGHTATGDLLQTPSLPHRGGD